MLLRNVTLIILLAPLLGSLLAGIGGRNLGKKAVHWITILLMSVSFLLAILVAKWVLIDGQMFNGSLYVWGASGKFQFDIGLLIDPLTTIMLLVVTFVSLLVHIYSVGYMADDPSNERFFSYVSFFTFAMLLLVTANNFLQLFMGWEGVGLASYLLIGFWFQKESAVAGSLKAFLVNRVGDFGFILGLAAILDNFGSLDYSTVFAKASSLANATIQILPNHSWHLMTVICILLFIGAMGKSAQIPLHVWLPESMEGPTPISALIHAATMVTAGVFMVTRMSPLYAYAVPAQSFVMIIGATGALFLGLLAFVENDIKRVIAYSTMSQLGYMMAAVGASAYSAGIFHLMTHACFKALLFLSAGSVIVAMHHEQDLRNMGNLKKYLPVTYVCFLIGALALTAIPPFAGYYSKDAIIEAIHHATIPGAHYAYWCLLIGAFVTGYYIFRAFFLAFHTQERMNETVRSHLKEYWIMLLPMIGLAIPSVILGFLLVKKMLYASPDLLGSSVTVLPQFNVMSILSSEFHNVWHYTFIAITHLPCWFAVFGIVLAWVNCIGLPKLPEILRQRFAWIYYVLIKKYGFDSFNQLVIVRMTRWLSNFFFRYTDEKLLDGYIVNGSGRNVTRVAKLARLLQSGYVYHYVFVMIVGVLAFLLWMFFVR